MHLFVNVHPSCYVDLQFDPVEITNNKDPNIEKTDASNKATWRDSQDESLRIYLGDEEVDNRDVGDGNVLSNA